MNLLYTAQVPAGTGPFPTILALHGWGSNAHDLLGLAPILHGGKALVLCPQGPVQVPVGPSMLGFGWFPLSSGAPPSPEEFAQAGAMLREFLDQALERYPVDRNKLVVLGFSQGGVMAYDLFLRQPERFAGLVALSSWLPESIAATIPVAESQRDRPVLVMHGTKDEMISVDRARESRALLSARGVNLSYREYEMGHEISRDALGELIGWLDEKVLSPIQLV